MDLGETGECFRSHETTDIIDSSRCAAHSHRYECPSPPQEVGLLTRSALLPSGRARSIDHSVGHLPL